MKTFEFNAAYVRCENAMIKENTYANNGTTQLAVVDADTGEMLCVATTNVPGYRPKPGYVLIKNWSENESVFEALHKAGIVGEVEDSVPVGYVKALLCKYNSQEGK